MQLIRRLAEFLLVEIILLSLLITHLQADFQSTIALLIFNALFISLMSRLQGNPLTKLGLITAGNILFATWNCLFHALTLSVASINLVSDSTLKVLYTISYPLFNSFLVISFWSLSLTFLRFRAPQVIAADN
ncbi:MAG: hypothetical protein NWE93_12665 [Candidatus Bathyarchaeota archaeon]|nr:hypothetical protein [Candidatus Bathyarchaeota archaeon]